MVTLLQSSYGAQLAQVCGALIIVIALAFIIMRFVASRGIGMSKGQRMQVVERLPLGPRQSLMIVKVGAQYMLVGVSEGSIQHLKDLDAEDVTGDLEKKASVFAEQLKKAELTTEEFKKTDDFGKSEAA